EGNYSGFPIENEEDFKMSLERLKPLIGYESFDDEFEYAGNNTFQQVYKGVPVYRSVVKVRTDENMLPIELSVSYKNNISIPTTEPGITIEQAYEFINEYDIYYAEEDMQLYIIDMDMDETYYKLSWVVTVSENYPHLAGGKEYPGETVYCLDARNGDLLRRYEMVVDVDF
ncbi:MAG: hypothetical protein LBS21_13260, partial [Clostridiales bacterium]|nr:hypothetical protein [Clostridiales bacterium]